MKRRRAPALTRVRGAGVVRRRTICVVSTTQTSTRRGRGGTSVSCSYTIAVYDQPRTHCRLFTNCDFGTSTPPSLPIVVLTIAPSLSPEFNPPTAAAAAVYQDTP